MYSSIKWIVFVTGWMTFRAVGSTLFLFWTITGNERAAPSEWVLPLIGDFIIGTTAFFFSLWYNKKTFLFFMGDITFLEYFRTYRFNWCYSN